jgi:hypothetical protein
MPALKYPSHTLQSAYTNALAYYQNKNTIPSSSVFPFCQAHKVVRRRREPLGFIHARRTPFYQRPSQFPKSHAVMYWRERSAASTGEKHFRSVEKGSHETVGPKFSRGKLSEDQLLEIIYLEIFSRMTMMVSISDPFDWSMRTQNVKFNT